MPNYISGYELEKQAKEQIKEIVMKMNGFSEKEVIDRYVNDPHFHKGFDVLVNIFM